MCGAVRQGQADKETLQGLRTGWTPGRSDRRRGHELGPPGVVFPSSPSLSGYPDECLLCDGLGLPWRLDSLPFGLAAGLAFYSMQPGARGTDEQQQSSLVAISSNESAVGFLVRALDRGSSSRPVKPSTRTFPASTGSWSSLSYPARFDESTKHLRGSSGGWGDSSQQTRHFLGSCVVKCE